MRNKNIHKFDFIDRGFCGVKFAYKFDAVVGEELSWKNV